MTSPTSSQPLPLRIELKKGRDSRPTLVCIRSDGSRTWSAVHAHFPVHDITHFAVESVLGFSQAFFGLIAAGWSIEEFAERGAAARMPAEALIAELVVGLLDQERASGQLSRADDLNLYLNQALLARGWDPFRPILDRELGAIRNLRGELQTAWSALDPGQAITVEFPAG
jgi:hypothetical protein